MKIPRQLANVSLNLMMFSKFNNTQNTVNINIHFQLKQENLLPLLEENITYQSKTTKLRF
jgi:hypothetical protein